MRSTRIALGLSLLTLTAVTAAATLRLRGQSQLSEQIHVDWLLWWTAVGAAYGGLILIGWWADARDRRKRHGRT